MGIMVNAAASKVKAETAKARQKQSGNENK
jgi:hypothetical protein